MSYDGKKLIVLSVQDSLNKPYNIKKPYTHQVKGNYLVITAPEIEMLMIHAANLYNEFQKVKSSKSPSQFLRDYWGIKESKLKSKKYIEDFFKTHDLIASIKEHSEKTKTYKKKNQIFLYDLIKEE